jgi:hypothetical protein
MFNKKVLAAAIVAATTVGSFTQVSAMELNEKGVGQALIGPVYYAEGSYKTDITVVNTRTDAAVKAKVVLRTHKDSVEVLDFLLYLSPADVWRGTIEATGTAGEARIVSSDDSMRVGDDKNGMGGTGGNEVTISQALNTATTGNIYSSTDTNDWGHVDVLGVYAIPAGAYSISNAIDGSNTVTVMRTMKKSHLAALFAEIDNNQAANRNQDFNLCSVSALQTQTGYARVSSISPCALELTGLVTIGVNGSHRASYTMHAMNAGHPNYVSMRDNFFGGTVTEASATTVQKAAIDDMYVVANYKYNELRTANSHLAYNWGLSGGATGAASNSATTGVDDGADGTRSNLQQYDAAVARTLTSWEYDAIADGTTNALVTFPTKYMHRNHTNNSASASAGINFYNEPCGTNTLSADQSKTGGSEYYSRPFRANGDVERSYVTYDNSENTSTSPEGDFSGGAVGSTGVFIDEVNYVPHAQVGYFSESTGGWGHIRYTNEAGTCTESRFGQDVSYSGFPALSLVYKIGGAGRLFEKTQDIE